MTGIIVLNHNTWYECTWECIQLVQQHTAPPYEIVLVDNGSATEEVEALREELPPEGQVKLVCSSTNLGCAAGNNLGLRSLTSTARLVCFLNSDCFIHEPVWNSKARAIFEEQEQLGAMSLTQGESAYFLDLETMESHGSVPVEEPYTCDWINGACLVIDRSRVGTLCFDEDFSPAYWEDVDLSFQIREQGWSVAQRPDFNIVHGGGYTTNKMKYGVIFQAEGWSVAHFYEKNRMRFFEKWKGISL